MNSVADKKSGKDYRKNARPIPLPTISECLQLMEETGMLENIRDHSFLVARVAETVNKKLQDNGTTKKLPDKQLLVAGALLHDIAKTECLEKKCDHAWVGGQICEQKGYFSIAEIVREHVYLMDFSEDRYKKGVFLAKELIYYCDKRVVHDTIVSLEERLKYILKRYGKRDPERYALINANFEQCSRFEKWLSHHSGLTPDKLVAGVEVKPYT